MLVFEKGESRKFIDENSSLVKKLEADGWELVKEIESDEDKIEKAKKAADKAKSK